MKVRKEGRSKGGKMGGEKERKKLKHKAHLITVRLKQTIEIM